jgi:Xaa-Pro dipeptidase
LPALALTRPPQEHVLLLTGERTPYRHDTDRELPFRQESNFFYLTGCAVPGAAALVRGAGAVQLFLPEIVDADLMWSIVRALPSPLHCAR